MWSIPLEYSVRTLQQKGAKMFFTHCPYLRLQLPLDADGAAFASIRTSRTYDACPVGTALSPLCLYCAPSPPPASLPPPLLQGKLRLSTGGAYPARYAMRFAAGFGSQVAFALYAAVDAVAPVAQIKRGE